MMKNQYLLLALITIAVVVLASRRMLGVPIPMLDLDSLTSKSTLVVTGTVVSLKSGPSQQVSDASGRFEARSVEGSIRPEELLKGHLTSSVVPFRYLLPRDFRGWRSVGLHQYALFFFNRGDDGFFHFTSPYYPYISVAPGGLARGSEPLVRVISVLSNTASNAKATDQQRLSAIRILASAQAPIAAARLRELLASGPLDLRVAVGSALLRKNNLSGLALVVNALLQRPPDVPKTIIQDAVAAVGWAVTNPQAIPQIEELLASSDPDVRRAASSALMRIGSPVSVGALQSELRDPDFQARYFAVVALARIAGQPQWRPTIDQFRSNESKYLEHWETWGQTPHSKR